MNHSPKVSRVLLALAVVWSSAGNPIPALAAELEAVPGARVVTTPVAPIVPGLNALVAPNLQTPAEIPALPKTAVAGLEASAAASVAQAAQTASAQALSANASQVETAASAKPLALSEATQTAQTEKPGVLARLVQSAGQALLGRGGVSWTKIFDANFAAPEGAMGIRPLPKPNLPDGFNLGDAPKTPDPKKVRTIDFTVNAIDAPGARGAGGILDSGPRVLNAKITGTPEEIQASVKEALLRMVDNDAAKWGVTRDELKEVHVVYVPAKGEQIAQVFAYFNQQRKTTNSDGTTQDVIVHGTSLSFTVNIVKNQPVLVAASAKLYPNLNVPTRATKTDDELKQGAEDQLRQMPQGADLRLVFAERRIVYHGGSWHAVNLYDIEGLERPIGVKVAIDIATGEIFAWDSRVGATAQPPAQEQGRFAIAWRGIRALTDEERAAIKEFLSQNGMTLASEGNGGTLLVVDGPVANMAAIVSDPIFKGWTIHRYSAPKMAYPEAALRVEAARKAAPAGAQLIGAAANFLNKSNIWAYRFYVPSTNQVLEVYVNFKGDVHVTDPRPAPSDTDFREIDLTALVPLSVAYRMAVQQGFSPVSVRIERIQSMAPGPKPVLYFFTDAAGKELKVPVAAARTLQAEAAEPDAGVSGVVKARAEANDHRTADGKPVLVDLSTPYIKFNIDGKADTADVDGKFAGNGKTFSATVESKWAKIRDTDRQELAVNVTLDPSKPNVVVLNADKNDENAINQVNMLIWINRIHDWWSQRLNGDKRIDKQIPVNVNIHQDCNAYYTPGRPSLNFFRSSEECSDTGRPGVGMHEYGHFVDDMIGGITNGGMSEGWGDIGSMFILGTPIIGEGFLKKRDPSWIRHGENTYQYNENDEVHDQGQAWMGFAWKLRKALIAAMGEAAGAAEAESLIVPTLFAKASDIPAQMAQVLLRAMDSNGGIRHEKEIRAAAKAHGIDLPQNPGIVGGVADLANGLVGIVTGGDSVTVEEVASGVFEGSNALVPEGFGQSGESEKVVTKTFSLKAGRASRDQIRALLQGAYQYRSGDYHDLGFKLEENKGWRGSQFTVTITGSEKSIEYMAKQIKRIGGQKEEGPAEKPPVGPNELRVSFAPVDDPAGSAPAAALAEGAPKPETSTWKDEIQVGGLLRGRFKSAFIQYCEREDLKYSITEDRHLLYSIFYVKVEGPKDKVWALYEWVQRLSRDSSLAASFAPQGATSGLTAGASQEEAPMLKPLVESWTAGDKTYGSTVELAAALPVSDAPVEAVYRFAHTDKPLPARPWANAGIGLLSGSLIGGGVGTILAMIATAIVPFIGLFFGGYPVGGGDVMGALIIPAMFAGMGALFGAMIGHEESKKPADPSIGIAGKIYRNAGPSGTTLYFETDEAYGGVRVDLGKYAQARPLPAPVMPARMPLWKRAAKGAAVGAALAVSQWIPLVQIVALFVAGPAVGYMVGSALSRDSGVAGGVLGGSLGLLVPAGAFLSFAAAGQIGILLSIGAYIAALAALGALVGIAAYDAVNAAAAVDAAQNPAGQWWAKAKKAAESR